MVVLATWMLIALYPFYVSRLVLMNCEIEMAAKMKNRSFWKKVCDFFA